MKKHAKRFLSALLVSVLLSQEVFADVTVPEVSAASFVAVQSPSDADYADEEPFYYDEDGNKVYDSDIDWPQYWFEPNYDDIMWTFEEYPETMMTNGDMDTYIVGVDDAVVVAIIGAACAACGVAIARSDIPDFVSKGFEPWLRRTKGNDTASMTMWQSLFKTTVGSAFVGMKVLTKNINEFLQSLTMSDSAISVPINSSVRGTPMCPGFDSNKYEYMHTKFAIYDDYTIYYDYAYRLSSFDTVVCGYLGSESSQVPGEYEMRIFSSTVDAISGSNRSLSLYRVSQSCYDAGYWGTASVDAKYYPSFPYELIYTFAFPMFINSTALRSWVEYGTTGGIVNGDADDFLSINTANQWTDLKQDFLTRWAVSDTFNIPATQDALDTLVDSLSKSQTGADVITTLNTVWTITDNNGGGDVVPVVAYTSLAYVLDTIAAYVGVSSLTAEQRNGFIADYLNVSLSGATIEQLSAYAQTIVKSQIGITGTAEDNDSNSFVVTSALTSAFLSYLLSIGLIDAIPEIKVGTQLKTNVKVETKIDSGTLPPDGGTADLSGILGLLTSILSTLGGLPGLISSEIIKALTSSAFANGITLNLDTIRSSLTNIAQWDFADWTAALGATMLLALKNFAIDIRLDGLVDVLDSIARWDFADWDTSLGSVLKGVLTALGFDKVVGLADVLKGWDFADWSSVFRSILDSALVTSGLAGVAGILSDISTKLKDLGITIDLSPLTDSLTGLKDAVIAIPGQITDFFTLDMAVVNTAYADLTTAFQGRFSGLYALSSVFDQKNRTFDDTPPVFTMPVPDALKIAYPDSDTIVIMDLRQHAAIFKSIRLILTAILWYMFAIWLLNQFDVKFHIG